MTCNNSEDFINFEDIYSTDYITIHSGTGDVYYCFSKADVENMKIRGYDENPYTTLPFTDEDKRRMDEFLGIRQYNIFDLLLAPFYNAADAFANMFSHTTELHEYVKSYDHIGIYDMYMNDINKFSRQCITKDSYGKYPLDYALEAHDRGLIDDLWICSGPVIKNIKPWEKA